MSCLQREGLDRLVTRCYRFAPQAWGAQALTKANFVQTLVVKKQLSELKFALQFNFTSSSCLRVLMVSGRVGLIENS